MQSSPFAILAALLACAVIGQGSRALAQGQPAQQPPKAIEEQGAIEDIGPNVVTVKGSNNSWMVQVLPGRSKVSFTGTAEPDFLKPKVNVKFTAAIDDDGKIKEEIK
jgi:hypothetical protein